MIWLAKTPYSDRRSDLPHNQRILSQTGFFLLRKKYLALANSTENQPHRTGSIQTYTNPTNVAKVSVQLILWEMGISQRNASFSGTVRMSQSASSWKSCSQVMRWDSENNEQCKTTITFVEVIMKFQTLSAKLF